MMYNLDSFFVLGNDFLITTIVYDANLIHSILRKGLGHVKSNYAVQQLPVQWAWLLILLYSKRRRRNLGARLLCAIDVNIMLCWFNVHALMLNYMSCNIIFIKYISYDDLPIGDHHSSLDTDQHIYHYYKVIFDVPTRKLFRFLKITLFIQFSCINMHFSYL